MAAPPGGRQTCAYIEGGFIEIRSNEQIAGREGAARLGLTGMPRDSARERIARQVNNSQIYGEQARQENRGCENGLRLREHQIRR